MGGHTAAHLLLGHTKNLAPLYSATPALLQLLNSFFTNTYIRRP
jgi:hypothetical protein